MKKHISIWLSVLLVLAMVAGLGGSASADAAVSGPSFEAQTDAQAFAVAMACWDNGFEVRDTIWPPFGWEATGWYAAWLYRTEGVDLLSAEEAKDFQLAIGMAEELGQPEDWLGARTPETFRSSDSSISYNFREYKLRIDELLGVELEVSVSATAARTETVQIRQHFGDHEQMTKTCMIDFEPNPNPDSRFPWRVAELDIPAAEPVVDPALTFTWDDLTKANTLENILSIYPSVRSYSRDYGYGGSTWLFLHGRDPVLLTGGDDYYSGRIHGCDFEYGETEDGSLRARIGYMDPSPDSGSMSGLNRYILDVFSDTISLQLDRIEGDLIWADAVYPGSYRQKLAFDYGTLVLRQVISLSEDGTFLGSMVYEYNNPAPELGFLDSWNGPLRSIDVMWESYSDGERNIRKETVRVPMDWEYLPYEARWGDYIPYTNEQCIGDYVYPGDSVEYLLFLTTVKG